MTIRWKTTYKKQEMCSNVFLLYYSPYIAKRTVQRIFINLYLTIQKYIHQFPPYQKLQSVHFQLVQFASKKLAQTVPTNRILHQIFLEKYIG